MDAAGLIRECFSSDARRAAIALRWAKRYYCLDLRRAVRTLAESESPRVRAAALSCLRYWGRVLGRML